MSDLLNHFERLFAWDLWANRESLIALGSMVNPKPLRWMSHIIGTEWLFLGRLENLGEPAIVWPDLSIRECTIELDELSNRWPPYLRSLSGVDLERMVAYTNSQGERWESRIDDMLQHVIAHGAYHRGQIAAATRAEGMDPAYTDYIHATRSHLI